MRSKDPIREYDTNGNLIHFKNSAGFEYWCEYDSNGNEIYRKYSGSGGYEYWCEYDSNNNLIHYKNSDGGEEWHYEGKLTNDPVKILMLATQLYSKVSQ
jgi:hypothetical protein